MLAVLFVAHLVGDYLFQTHDMATKKVSSAWWAFLHALTYSLAILIFFPTAGYLTMVVIYATHFLIDRFRLARYVCWFKNGARGPVTATGFPDGTPAFLSVWLLIITDNLIHILINWFALARL